MSVTKYMTMYVQFFAITQLLVDIIRFIDHIPPFSYFSVNTIAIVKVEPKQSRIILTGIFTSFNFLILSADRIDLCYPIQRNCRLIVDRAQSY